MTPDIFSSFDPMTFNMCLKSGMSLFIPLFILISSFWESSNPWVCLKSPMLTLMNSQLNTTESKNLKTLKPLISSLFIFIIYVNTMGMLPYLFSISSHIIFSISIGLPLWMSFIISSFLKTPMKTSAHLLPDGAPSWLNPFLVLIESTSIIVRPLTLSFRLAANMTAGHVVLNLLSSFSIKSLSSFSIMLAMSSLYLLFELTICLVQAYIFCLLLSLYTNDHQW